MSDFDDELRRILGDERLALTPRDDAVGRIVKGAHRRRTVRVVASAAGSIGLVAAVAIGSMAVTGQLAVGPDPAPPSGGETPAILPGPDLTPDPVLPTTTTPDPTGDPTGDASGDPAGEPPGTGDPSGDTPPDGPDPVDVTALPLLDPAAPFDGVQVRMTLAELQQVPGVEITRLRGDSAFPELCYGSFTTARAHGYISVRGAVGSPPDDLMGAYEVATLVPDVAVRTPEGIGVGSWASDVWAAYPETYAEDNGDLGTVISGLDGVASYWDFEVVDGVVTHISHDGAHNCGDDPQPLEDPDLAVLDPAGVDGVSVGMTLAELQALGGVEIDTAQQGGACYGSFARGDVQGWISHRSDLQSEGSMDTSEWRVTAIRTATGRQTPEGISAGSTRNDVLAAYPDLVEGSTFDSYATVPGRPDLRWVFNFDESDQVRNFRLEGGQNCYG